MSKPSTPKTIGERLAFVYRLHPGAYRNDASAFSLRELDRLADVGEGLASQIIGGHALNPTIGTLRQYAEVLGCKVGWLGAGEGDAPGKGAVVAGVAEARRRASAGGEGVAK
jgi:hypothetical protein